MSRRDQLIKKSVFLVCFMLMFGSVAFADDDDRQCPAPPEECAKKIRQAMAGQMYLGVIFYDAETGIYIKSVVPGSPAHLAGLEGGDFIVAIDGKDISDGNVKAFKKMFGNARKQGSVTLTVRRDDRTLTTTAHLKEITDEQITRIVAAHLDAAHSDNKLSSNGGRPKP